MTNTLVPCPFSRQPLHFMYIKCRLTIIFALFLPTIIFAAPELVEPPAVGAKPLFI